MNEFPMPEMEEEYENENFGKISDSICMKNPGMNNSEIIELEVVKNMVIGC